MEGYSSAGAEASLCSAVREESRERELDEKGRKSSDVAHPPRGRLQPRASTYQKGSKTNKRKEEQAEETCGEEQKCPAWDLGPAQQ